MKRLRNLKEIFIFQPAIRFGSLFSQQSIHSGFASASFDELRLRNLNEDGGKAPLNNIYIFINSLQVVFPALLHLLEKSFVFI